MSSGESSLDRQFMKLNLVYRRTQGRAEIWYRDRSSARL